MKKKILLSILAIVIVITSVAAFVGCDSGTYKANVLGTEFSIKLGMFGTVDFGANIDELAKMAGQKVDSASTKDTKIKYKVADEDKLGNRLITYTYEKDGKEIKLPIPSYLDKDGNLVIVPLILVLKK